MATEGNKKKVLVAIMVVLAVAAVAVYALTRSDSTIDPNAVVKVHCSKCNAEFDMPYGEWHSKTDGVEKPVLTCPKCGAPEAVTRAVPKPPPDEDQGEVQSDQPQAVDAATGGASEEQPAAAPKKKKARSSAN